MTSSATFLQKTINFCNEEGVLARFSCRYSLGCIVVAYQAYCMKCKNTVIVRSPKEILMSNGRTRVSGICSEDNCDGKLSKIIS